jgi:hypothetical protein
MPRIALVLLGGALALVACSKQQTAQDKTATNAALSIAERPSAGTVAAETANRTDPGPPPVTLSEAIESQADEADPQLRAKVDAATRIVPANSVEATPGRP